MPRSRGSLTLFAFALVAVPTVLVAQTSSALTGVVKDSAGRPVVGALVRISSPSMIGGERTATSSANGSYRFSAVPPGTFRISVSAKGQPTLSQNTVLELGRTETVNWTFPASSATAIVEVVATAARVDDATVTQTQNYDTASLATLPVDRSINAIMDLTPGVNSNRAWGGYSGENAYMMDGMNISNPSGGSVWIYPNIDWFSEVQVAGLGANAEFGGFMGGFVNGLVKRGGNTPEGSISYQFSDSKWQARVKTNHPMVEEWQKDILPSKNWDAAISMGGPIVKDKLWYFVSAERTEEDDSPTGAPLTQRNQKVMALAKVTWAPTANSTLEFLAEHDYVGRDRRGIDYTTMPEATQKESAPNHSYSLTWTQTIGQDKVFTLKAFGYGGRYDMPGYGGNAEPLDTADLYNGKEFYRNSQYEEFNYRGRASVLATFDLFKSGLLSSADSHAFRFGIEREQASDEELQRFPGNNNLNAGVDEGGVYTDYMITGGGWNVRQRTDRLAIFAQDTWKVNERLTLNPGLRFEQFKARFYGGENVWNKSTVAPRFGFAFALTEDQTTMLKGHWGKYYAGYSTYFIDRSIQSAIPEKVYYNWGNYDYIDPKNPSSWPDFTPGTDTNYEYRRINDLTTVDPNAKQPYTEETTVSVDHKFKGPWSISASYVMRDFKDSLVRKDLAADPDGASVDYFDPLHQTSIPIWVTGLLGNEHKYVVTNTPEAKRKYTSATIGIERKLENNWNFSATYTHATLKGNIQRADSYDKVFYNRNLQANSDGNLPGVNDNEFKARGLYTLPWNMRISAIFTYLSGEHWTPTYRTTSQDGTRYVVNTQPLGSETYPSRTLLDIRLTQVFNLSKKSNVEVFGEVLNVLNRQAVTEYTTRVNGSNGKTSGDLYDYYKYPDTVDAGRRLKFGVRFNF